MSSHDPLCQKANVMEIRFGNVCSQCDLIGRIRADERLRIRKGVLALQTFWDGMNLSRAEVLDVIDREEKHE